VTSFARIDEAIAQLGYPEVVWFRGHSATHQLLPWLFRFPDALQNEAAMAKRFRPASHTRSPPSGLQALIAMHYAYLPARLLAWTESLAVALFCALAREAPNPTIFVLNPFRLNGLSNINGVLKAGAADRHPSYFSDWPEDSTLPEFPVAVDGHVESYPASSETIFTIHGTDSRPIEQQCPDCVRKVVLTKSEGSAAVRRILCAGSDG
jgi:hypothetical protein